MDFFRPDSATLLTWRGEGEVPHALTAARGTQAGALLAKAVLVRILRTDPIAFKGLGEGDWDMCAACRGLPGLGIPCF